LSLRGAPMFKAAALTTNRGVLKNTRKKKTEREREREKCLSSR
jgi:hypothetical protein